MLGSLVLNGSTTPSLALALVAGLASFLSPCVLPLVPAYIGYLGGRAVVAPGERRTPAQRLTTFLHALAFVVGFSVVFIALGLAAGSLGRLLHADWVRWIGGLVMVFFGMALMGWVKLPFLYTERRVHIQARPGWGYLSSLLVGISFAAGWTPCIGPVLGSILALSLSARSAALLVAYSIGLGLPFLLVALAVDQAMAFLRGMRRHLQTVQIVTGVLLILFGVLLFMDWLRVIGDWMMQLGIGWDLGL
ncbi:MAG TPA: cytochrome c biogenesis protein CcdA [Chloroflexi bacterium]|nr:cytochrome c biogenesis protein CcdA [Chloroflexota bacterium]